MNPPVPLRAIRHQPSLSVRAADDLRRAIVDGLYDAPGRLPAEPELARQLGVSRATLRHAIAVLQDEGLVTRRHGSGTFVVGRAAELRNNLNVNFGVTDLIEAAGWKAGTRHQVIAEERADIQTAKALDLPPRSRVVVISRTRTADERPVARTIDYMAAHLIDELGVRPEDLTSSQSLYRGLEAVGLVVHHGIAEIRPARADRAMSAELEVPFGTLLLHLTQVDYTSDGDALLVSQEYYVADALTVQVYRKGSGTRS